MVFSDTGIRRADGSDWTVGSAIESLKAAIWQRRPVLGNIMQKHGSKNLFTYAKDFLDVNPSPVLDARKPELIAMAKDLTADRLGQAAAETVAAQLREKALVSTTDHHGPIQHPFFVNANIISALPYKDARDPALRSLIVFSFSSISLNNASTYARGLLFHGGMNGTRNCVKLPIFPDRQKMSIVYATRAYTEEDLTRAHGDLNAKVRVSQVTPERAEKVHHILDTHFGDPDVLASDDLNQQCTKINYRMWPALFGGPHQIPDLIYIDIESLVRRLLTRKHLRNSGSLMYKIIFDPAYRKLMLTYFDNIPGAFSLEKKWGSFLFWGIEKNGHRVRLFLKDNTLESQDSAMHFELTPDAIAEALTKRNIYPGMMLCYLMVSLYYGMKCLGGFCQVHDLTIMKAAWASLLRQIGENKEADALEPLQTKELGGDGLVLSYMKTLTNELVPATGIDMLIEPNGDQSYEHYLALSKKVTLEEMMQPMLPEMYSVLYPQNERDPFLTTLLPEQIGKSTGLQEKLMEPAQQRRV